MYIYIIILLLIFMMSFFKKSKYLYGILMVFLFLFAALRGNGDGDYFAYKKLSLEVKSLENVFIKNIPIEIGFRIISYFINLLKLNSQWVIIVMNGISLYFINLFFQLNSKDKIFSILIFYFFYLQYDMHASRTAVAIALGCVGMNYLWEEKKIKAFIFFWIATSFHSSAIVLFLIFLLKIIQRSFFVSFFGIVLAYINIILFSLDEIIIKILNVIGMKVLSLRYLGYTKSEKFGYAFKLYDPRLILSIITYTLMHFLIVKLKNETLKKKYHFYNSILWLGIIVMITLSEHTAIAIRTSSYFVIVVTILVPNVLQHFNKKFDYLYIYYIFLFKLIYVGLSFRVLADYVEYKFYF